MSYTKLTTAECDAYWQRQMVFGFLYRFAIIFYHESKKITLIYLIVSGPYAVEGAVQMKITSGLFDFSV